MNTKTQELVNARLQAINNREIDDDDWEELKHYLENGAMNGFMRNTLKGKAGESLGRIIGRLPSEFWSFLNTYVDGNEYRIPAILAKWAVSEIIIKGTPIYKLSMAIYFVGAKDEIQRYIALKILENHPENYTAIQVLSNLSVNIDYVKTEVERCIGQSVKTWRGNYMPLKMSAIANISMASGTTSRRKLVFPQFGKEGFSA